VRDRDGCKKIFIKSSFLRRLISVENHLKKEGALSSEKEISLAVFL